MDHPRLTNSSPTEMTHPTRRDFLTTAATAVAVSAAGPRILGAQDKAGAKAPVVGQGAYTYECVHDWARLPENFAWQTTHGVTVDSAGLVYVVHQGHGKQAVDTVAVFDPDGAFVRSFGRAWHGGGHGIDLRREGPDEFLYLAYTTGKVIKTDLRGEPVWVKEGPPPECGLYSPAMRYRPTNVAFAPDGGFWIADGYGSNLIHRYNRDGAWVSSLGGTGKALGELRTPHGLWLDSRPGQPAVLCVCDRANARLQNFDLAGKPLSVHDDVLYPANIDIRGEVMLIADLHARLTLLDKSYAVLAHLGEDPAWRKTVLDAMKVRSQPARWQPGRFVHPHDACFDAAGNIFVTEWVTTGRVSLLRHLA